MAAAGFISPRLGMLISAGLAVLGIVVGRSGLPVPGGPLHFPNFLQGFQIARLVRHGGPSAAALHQHRWRPADLGRGLCDLGSPFGPFLIGWFAFSLAVSSFGSLYPVLMRSSFGVQPSVAATLMSIATAVSIPLYNLPGRLQARWGSASVLRIGYLGRLIPLAGLAALAYARPDFAFGGAIALYAVFQGIWPLLSVASNETAASLAPFGEGPAMGVFNVVAAIGSALGAIAGGAIADGLGYAAVPLFAATGIAVAVATVRQRPVAAMKAA